MTHIGGYPRKYKKEIETEIQSFKPDIYICGHSHILKIMYDKIINLYILILVQLEKKDSIKKEQLYY